MMMMMTMMTMMMMVVDMEVREPCISSGGVCHTTPSTRVGNAYMIQRREKQSIRTDVALVQRLLLLLLMMKMMMMTVEQG
jgi:hypothetical protein